MNKTNVWLFDLKRKIDFHFLFTLNVLGFHLKLMLMILVFPAHFAYCVSLWTRWLSELAILLLCIGKRAWCRIFSSKLITNYNLSTYLSPDRCQHWQHNSDNCKNNLKIHRWKYSISSFHAKLMQIHAAESYLNQHLLEDFRHRNIIQQLVSVCTAAFYLASRGKEFL